MSTIKILKQSLAALQGVGVAVVDDVTAKTFSDCAAAIVSLRSEIERLESVESLDASFKLDDGGMRFTQNIERPKYGGEYGNFHNEVRVPNYTATDQDPVAWMDKDGEPYTTRRDGDVPLYTHPAPVLNQEPIGEIVDWPNDFTPYGVEWKDKTPPVGTKLYAHPIIDSKEIK